MPVISERSDEFAEVFATYAPAVSYFFARRGFPPEDCRDLTQETFLKAYRGLARFRDDADVRTWILSIAANVWKNALRSRQAVKRSAAKTVPLESLSVEEVPVDAEALGVGASRPPSPLQDVLADERRRELRKAVAELPPRMRRCVRLRIDHGLKYGEIASILQVSVDTVKTQLHQARKRLREALGEYFLLADDEE